MRTIVHLSDLHFGRVRPELVDPLLEILDATAPDLVVISGDLTQRARVRQFQAARAFLDRINAPSLVVPGNHDVPLDNMAVRLLAPWRRYRQAISPVLEPAFEDPEIAVVGVNTVNPLDWQRGRISRARVARICASFGSPEDNRTRIVVAHHPFAHEAGERKSLMRGAKRAIQALAGCGAHIVLCGHLHIARAEPILLDPGQPGQVLLVQAGTGLSSRLRGEANDFNLLRVEQDEVRIERLSAGERGFTPTQRLAFRRQGDGWKAIEGEVATVRS